MSKVAYINGGMLRYARKKRRVSLRRLAQQLRVKPSTLEAWEDGSKSPSFSATEKIAEILEFPHGMLWLSKTFDGRHRFCTRDEYRAICQKRIDYINGIEGRDTP